ncbi:endonuclease domain-containing protein [Pelagerythrobacter marinus]|uniref:endonuclease domain-containing protein n=1 Tax=Pelagerythrobacter marinus TaxID=538382 RepID=UPI0020367ABD|nr:DUF559 domain-containing protein [Pelagerythrobacter marinus]USA40052.1 DUF559 domain-containing protein [Pelagerythrobacter marinus]WPZ05828.1 DUF559 domain-containing protein [Pelagerythrobacter marinus]
MNRPAKPKRTVARAKRLRREMSLPEILLWQQIRGSPRGIRFRKQHAAGPYALDFFCARANLAIEIDGLAHDMGDRPARDEDRDAWLRERRVETLRIPAREVMTDAVQVAEGILALVEERLMAMGKKAPPSAAGAAATSPSQADGEDLSADPPANESKERSQ